MSNAEIVLKLDDVERDLEMAWHPDFSSNGKSYGVAIYVNGAFEERVYAPSEGAAFHNAQLRARELRLSDGN